MKDRLMQQLNFIVEIDKEKEILRQNVTTVSRKQEDDAEHSWHLAIMAVLLQEYCTDPIDITRVIKMLLIHDIVEIDCGDVFLYDEKGNLGKAEREMQAAKRIFGLLPDDQAAEYIALFKEFDAKESADSLFANSMDRLQPLLLNMHSGGHTWQMHEVHSSMVLKRTEFVSKSAPELYKYIQELVVESVAKGLLGN